MFDNTQQCWQQRYTRWAKSRYAVCSI